MTIGSLIIAFCASSALAIAFFFAVNERLVNYRYQQLMRDTTARWQRLEFSRKFSVLQSHQATAHIGGASEADLDRIFDEFLANTCQQLRQQGSFDLSWLRLE